MSTSDTPIAQQGRKYRNTTTSSIMPHQTSNFQAHTLNSQTTLYSSQPATPPRTPRRTQATTVVPADTSNDAPPNSSAKMKSRTKNRPKHVVTSPSAPRNIRATPPLTGAQSAGLPKTGKTPIAYAGPTFHASPAPSALPLPSFYSKSVPESPAPISINSVKDETETSSNGSSDSPTPPTTQLNGTQNQREESPLDFFFIADRAERAKARGSSSGTGPFQPPFESPPANQTPTILTRANSSQLSGRRPSSMFAMELDSPDNSRKPMGAPFATPYNERIRAARSTSSQDQSLRNNSQEAPVTNTSQALRDYLFSGTALPTRSSAPAVPTLSNSPSRSASGPPTPVNNPRISRHPHHTDFTPNKESFNSPRTTSRTSGLRQEIPQNTPIKPDISDRVTSAPPKMSTHLPLVKDSIQYINPKPLPNGGLATQRSRSDDLLELEERLREKLKMSPAKKGCDFHYGSTAPVHRAGFNE